MRTRPSWRGGRQTPELPAVSHHRGCNTRRRNPQAVTAGTGWGRGSGEAMGRSAAELASPREFAAGSVEQRGLKSAA